MGSTRLNEIENRLKSIVIPSDLGCVRQPETAVLEEIEKHGFSEDAIFAIKLTLEEAITNAIKHGNKGDRSKKVIIRYFVDSQQAVICIKDEGPGFDPQEVPDPTAPDRLSLPNGRGILLMRAYMNDVIYRDNGRETVLVKLNE